MEEIAVMYWYVNDINGWGYALMTISMLAVWGLVITGVVLLVRQSARTDSLPVARTSNQVLAERFARGEIDETEYTSRLATLHGQTAVMTGVTRADRAPTPPSTAP
jgi:putative membrane protein